MHTNISLDSLWLEKISYCKNIGVVLGNNMYAYEYNSPKINYTEYVYIYVRTVHAVRSV